MPTPKRGITLQTYSLISSWVFGGIQDRGDSAFDILGDVFLKNVYAVELLTMLC